MLSLQTVMNKPTDSTLKLLMICRGEEVMEEQGKEKTGEGGCERKEGDEHGEKEICPSA